MTPAGRVANVSRAFADRNSLRTGNLTGNLQNSGEFTPFVVPARLIAWQYQEVGVNSLFREPREFLPEKQGIRPKGIGASTSLQVLGVQGHFVLAARTGCKDIGCSVPGWVIARRKNSDRAKRD